MVRQEHHRDPTNIGFTRFSPTSAKIRAYREPSGEYQIFPPAPPR
jgi:hypothetical protein